MARQPVLPPRSGSLAPTEKLRLIAEIVGLYVVARRSLRSGDLPAALAHLRGQRVRLAQPVDGASELAVGRSLGSITTRTLAALPGDGRCLTRSLVLTGLLARRGIGSKLVLAVYPGEKLAAHAWVEYEGAALLEPGAPPLERLTAV